MNDDKFIPTVYLKKLTIRIDSNKKEQFKKLVKQHGLQIEEVLISCIDEYIKNNNCDKI